MTSDEVPAARETVIEALGRSAEVYGASRSVGRVYGRLFFAENALSLDELVERTGYAKSTVSTATDTLERFHLVTRRSPPGEGKRAFYEANRDLWRVFQQFLDREVRREIDIMTEALAEAEDTLSEVESERAGRDLERVQDLRQTYERAQTAVGVVSRLPVERLRSLASSLGVRTDKR
ncbi:MAG: GbsR/MarR family transcriptional regulator [Halobacteriaceae archaeon]